jgi:hypothetical protein
MSTPGVSTEVVVRLEGPDTVGVSWSSDGTIGDTVEVLAAAIVALEDELRSIERLRRIGDERAAPAPASDPTATRVSGSMSRSSTADAAYYVGDDPDERTRQQQRWLARLEVLDGLLVALDRWSEISETVAQAPDRAAALVQLQNPPWALTAVQANHILDIRLAQLSPRTQATVEEEATQVREWLRRFS